MTVSEDQQKLADVRYTVESLYSQLPDWVTFYREILGLHGIVRRCYGTRESLARFEQTEEYKQIQQMLAKLRKRGSKTPKPEEPVRVVTVRLPKSLHEALIVEAHEHRTSMNRLCISKLLRMVDTEMVPDDVER